MSGGIPRRVPGRAEDRGKVIPTPDHPSGDILMRERAGKRVMGGDQRFPSTRGPTPDPDGPWEPIPDISGVWEPTPTYQMGSITRIFFHSSEAKLRMSRLGLPEYIVW